MTRFKDRREQPRCWIHAQGVLWLVLVLFTSMAEADEPLEFAMRPGLPYLARRSEPIVFDVDFAVTLTAPYHTKVLKVWLPLPQSDAAQEISKRNLSVFPQRVEPKIGREAVYGNQFAYFEFHEPQGAQIIRHRFQAKVSQLRWRIEPRQVSAPEPWPERFAPYLTGQTRLDKDAGFQALLGTLTAKTAAGATDFMAAIEWINATMTYDHARASLRADANHAWATHHGHCSDYHGLCAAMGRELGFPTRITYGLNLFPKNSPSHCKVECFLPPYGWVSFDLSETQKLIERINRQETLTATQKRELSKLARERLLHGFRENSWLLVTRGANYELAPPGVKPVAVVRTIYAEADGEPLPDPDPANIDNREFAWMTAHEFKPDRPIEFPYNDWRTLLPKKSKQDKSSH